jgi:hypothetical protein
MPYTVSSCGPMTKEERTEFRSFLISGSQQPWAVLKELFHLIIEMLDKPDTHFPWATGVA